MISCAGRTYAYIVRADQGNPEKTTFVTPDSCIQQVGFVVHEAGAEIARHYHRPVEREIAGTPEVLIVRAGRCEVQLYDDDRNRLAARELAVGDLIAIVAGGHSFRMIEDTVLIEVKQGPYDGPSEKRYF